MRTRMRKQKKMAAPIDSKWRPPWSRSNFVSAAAILEIRDEIRVENLGQNTGPREKKVIYS